MLWVSAIQFRRSSIRLVKLLDHRDDLGVLKARNIGAVVNLLFADIYPSSSQSGRMVGTTKCPLYA